MNKSLRWCHISMLLALLILNGCGKKEEWSNNPSKVVVAKSGESLAEVGKRLIGRRIDSLGIPLSKDNASYYSNPIWLGADSTQLGQPILDVTQWCSNEKPLPLGELFQNIDCNTSLDSLSELAKDKSSNIIELCNPLSMDRFQYPSGYANPSNKVYWQVGDGRVLAMGVYENLASRSIASSGLYQCDIAARNKFEKEMADEKKWFVEEGIGGIALNKCKVSDGPAKMIELSQTIGENVGVSNEIKEGNVIVQTTLDLYSRGVSVTFYRGSRRCEAAISKRSEDRKKVADKYK